MSKEYKEREVKIMIKFNMKKPNNILNLLCKFTSIMQK